MSLQLLMKSMSLFKGFLHLNLIIASLPHLQGCIDFRGVLINLLFAAVTGV